MKERFARYRKYFSTQKLWEKLKNNSKRLGVKTIAYVLILYYVMQKDDVPAKDKTLILGSLGYFILPTDFLPDFLIAGYTDDMIALIFAVKSCVSYIDDDIKIKIMEKLKGWFDLPDDYLIELISKIK